MFSINELYIQDSFLNIVYIKMVFDFNMLGSLMYNWILWQTDSSIIITEKGNTVSINLIFFQLMFHPK